jgi:hypothetical protein
MMERARAGVAAGAGLANFIPAEDLVMKVLPSKHAHISDLRDR